MSRKPYQCEWHVLKCWSKDFEAIIEGKKPYEVRNGDDRNYKDGDVLVLREWLTEDDAKERRRIGFVGYIPDEGYTHRVAIYEVTYVTRADHDKRLPLGKIVVMGLKKWEQDLTDTRLIYPITERLPVPGVAYTKEERMAGWIRNARRFLYILEFLPRFTHLKMPFEDGAEQHDLRNLLQDFPEQLP